MRFSCPDNMLAGRYDASARPVRPYSDPALPVPIMQGQWEFSQLVSIYREMGVKSALEIGSFFGGTLWHWIKYSRPGATVVSVDMLVSETDPRYAAQMESRARWGGWAEANNVKLVSLLGDSSSPATLTGAAAHAPYDFVFIDGGHSYECAKADFLNYGPMVRSGGVIAFHDILWSQWWTSVEVHRLWNEIVKAGYRIRELYSSRDQTFNIDRSTWGIGVVYVD